MIPAEIISTLDLKPLGLSNGGRQIYSFGEYGVYEEVDSFGNPTNTDTYVFSCSIPVEGITYGLKSKFTKEFILGIDRAVDFINNSLSKAKKEQLEKIYVK